MAFTFPTSPTNGQTYVMGGVTYTYNSANDTWVGEVTGGASSTLPIAQLVLSSSGTYTVPSGVSSILVLVRGAIGSVISDTVLSYSMGGSGGAGYSEKTIAVTAGQTFSYTIGAIGGTTTFSTISITSSPTVNLSTTGSAGGVATGGDFNANGGKGGNGLNSTGAGGGGGGGAGSRAGVGGIGGNGNGSGGGGGGGGPGGNNGSNPTGGAATSTEAAGVTVIPWIRYPITFNAGQSGYTEQSGNGANGGYIETVPSIYPARPGIAVGGSGSGYNSTPNPGTTITGGAAGLIYLFEFA